MASLRIDNFVIHNRGGTDGVARINARYLAHVTVLASHACSICGRSSILIPDHLQFDSRLNGNLVTRHAECTFIELFKLNDTPVN